MDILKQIILLTIISIMLGCCLLANIDKINDYFTEMSVSPYDRYEVRKIDETDVKFINLVVPNVKIDVLASPAHSNTNNSNTNNSKATNIVQTPISRVLIDPKTGRPFTNGTNNTNNTKNMNNMYDPENIMNTYRGTISDNFLTTHDGNDKTFGFELPWDREIGHCEVLANTDRDLYKSVQNSKILTFF